MIRASNAEDLKDIEEIINDAAGAYKGVIPEDCFHTPYMSARELLEEVIAGVRFWGWYESPVLLGVMGIQQVKEVTLIRHAYVRTVSQGLGIGGALLDSLIHQTQRPLLVGTWAAASWAIRLYERHGFILVAAKEKDLLLNTYWKISPRQRQHSVVLIHKKHMRELTQPIQNKI